MKYMGMPMGMWVLFVGSFQKQLTAVLGYDAAIARAITKKAKPQYRQIIRRLPEFEKADRFKMNIVNCAMLGAFIWRSDGSGIRGKWFGFGLLYCGGKGHDLCIYHPEARVKRFLTKAVGTVRTAALVFFAFAGIFMPDILQKIHAGRVAAAYRMCYDEVQNLKRSDGF